MKLPIRTVLTVGVALGSVALGACASIAQTPPIAAAGPVADNLNGPAADYPMVLGDPFTIDGVLYTPADTLNYDHVGYVAADALGASGVTGAHRTLPLPSYIEVTALDSGKTILVRLERRGPMDNASMLALAPDALAQLGIAAGAPVRMRRVNPPEDQRAELRAGRAADPRMETPEGLLAVLRRRLPSAGSVPLSDPRQAAVSGMAPPTAPIATLDPDEEIAMVEPDKAVPAADVTQEPTETEEAIVAETPVAARTTPRPTLARAMEGGPARAPIMVPTDPDGRFTVQIGAFSVPANAMKLAREVQGNVDTSGRLAIVSVGPFATRGQAEQALAKLRSRGYSDALIKSTD